MLVSLFLSTFISSYNNTNLYTKVNSDNIRTSAVESNTKQWLENRLFDDNSSWTSLKEGDVSDVDAYIDQGWGNFIVHGDLGVMEIDDPLNNIDWQDYNNPEFPISPDTNGSSSAGLYITHQWHESIDQTRNTPSIHWKRNITMPVNFSDYIITDAFLEVVYNASVQALDHDGGGIEVHGDYTEGQNPPADTQFAVGDFATFYVLVSDIDNKNVFQIAINKTTNLGQDSPEITTYPDTFLDVVPKNLLISYLNSVLDYDNFHFTITLGIDIYCEDNEYNVDIDNWNMLIMRTFNLTFTYKKNVNRLTSISFEQVGDQITGENARITNALLNFVYKIDTPWPSVLSPNSEIRVFINDKKITETIKLGILSINPQEAFPGNLDVTSFISKDIDISLSIQIFLADNFGLDEDIIISIDRAFLQISWNVVYDDPFREPWFFRLLLVIASVAGLSIGGYLYAYQKILKYPKPVRKVRKYRRTLTKKKEPTVIIANRESAFKKEYKQELQKSSSFLKGKPSEPTSAKETLKQPAESKKTPEGIKNL
ncbi:MAG: hypothetical protein ACFE9C_07040 [Candidatus Hodarchaeota archaeon]